MLAFVFPGQGSQKKGMGQGLFDEVKEYAAIEKDVDALLGYSMRQLCLEDPDNKLKETQYTQPALYVVNALHCYKALSEGVRPTHLAGHSFGEYDALLAAGAFDLLTGLRLVKKRGELMSQAKNGGMVAVIGMDGERVTQVIRENHFNVIDVAIFNSPSQVVIAGPADELKRVSPIFEAAGARKCMALQVSGAFHSRYLADAGRAFEDYLTPVSFAAPKLPVIANVTALPYPTENASTAIKSLLVRQLTQSVQWTQSVRYLIAQGVTEFKEIGPGNVLTRLIDQIKEKGG